MSEDRGRAIFEYLVQEIVALRDKADEHHEVAARVGGFAVPVELVVTTMEYHTDGLIKVSGNDMGGQPREVFLPPDKALLDIFLRPVAVQDKVLEFGFRVIGDEDR